MEHTKYNSSYIYFSKHAEICKIYLVKDYQRKKQRKVFRASSISLINYAAENIKTH